MTATPQSPPLQTSAPHAMPTIRRQILAGGICVLTFDRPDSSANIFDHATLVELGEDLDAIAQPESGVNGLVLMSAKDAIFVAGADLYSIRKMSADALGAFIALGQDVFTRIAELPFPSVAAIHGVAVGGGCEVCLACDWRVASPDAVTKIGLPETKLGILPAWGGCARLPRIIGVPAALDIILGGKILAAKHARKIGVIDELAAREYLLPAALRLLERGKHPRRLIHSAPVNAVVDAVIKPQVHRQTRAKTHGHYPAVEKAMEVVMHGASAWSEEEALKLEREAIGELVRTESTRHLLNLFFLQERAKKLVVPHSTPGHRPPAIAKVAVIGAGIMGSGIAQWLSTRDLPVILRDVDATRVAAGMGNITRLYGEAVKRRVFTEREARRGIERIAPAPGEAPLESADLVIEAAVEKLDIKKAIFRTLDDQVREDCVLATNTSALSITELAAATRHPQRVVGIHFFNPVHKMQLVEVVMGRDTAPDVAQRAVQFVQKIGKLPVLVKDSPGFLVNRILLPCMIEAGSLFQHGARIEEIDGAMIDFGMPVGPLALCDEVGIDIAADVAHTLAAAFPAWMRVPEILARMTSAGLLGRKSGAGFFVHGKAAETAPNPAAETLRSAGGASALTRDQLQRRMVFRMVNESARVLEEGVVATAADVDFAMVTGTGWAPFRGGPLRYADSVGASHIVEELTALGGDFAPCALLIEKAKTGGRFHAD